MTPNVGQSASNTTETNAIIDRDNDGIVAVSVLAVIAVFLTTIVSKVY
jgi:hypothetical protein